MAGGPRAGRVPAGRHPLFPSRQLTTPAWAGALVWSGVIRLSTDEGVAVGGAFDTDTAPGMMSVAHRVAAC